MHFKASVEYGMRAVLYLAEKGSICSSREVADEMSIPRDYLIQLARCCARRDHPCAPAKTAAIALRRTLPKSACSTSSTRCRTTVAFGAQGSGGCERSAAGHHCCMFRGRTRNGGVHVLNHPSEYDRTHPRQRIRHRFRFYPIPNTCITRRIAVSTETMPTVTQMSTFVTRPDLNLPMTRLSDEISAMNTSSTGSTRPLMN